MTETKTSTIQSKVIFSMDGKYRYYLEKVWDIEKKIATVIMINPSIADELKMDISVCKLMNFLIDTDDKKYGSLRIVNLYAQISSEPKKIKNNVIDVEILNDKYILESLKETDLVIVAWGIEKNKYTTRKKKIYEMLKNNNISIKGFKDKDGRIGRHPSRINDFILDNYSYE